MSGFPTLTATMRDGTPVLIREGRPEDAELVRLGFQQLSDRSRQFRFMRAMPKLKETDLEFLAHPESEMQEAIGALDTSVDPPRPVGLARYVILPGTDHRAEFAVTVIDSHQGKGLGTMLLGYLAWHAERRGIEGFVALVGSRNRVMLELLSELSSVIEQDYGGELHLFVPLHRDATLYPDTPAGRVFRATHAEAEAAVRD